MKYLRRQTLNTGNVFDDTFLQRPDGNIELNPTQKVIINGDLVLGSTGNIPSPEVTNVMYVTMDGDDSNDGRGEGPMQAKRTIKSAVEAAEQGTTIFVRSGDYYEDNPIKVPPKVSIVGDNLRRTIVRPLNKPVVFEISLVERTDNIVTITTNTTHSLILHDRVRIDCLSDSAFDEETANIIEVTSTTFKYRNIGPDYITQGAAGTVKKGFDLFLLNSANYLAQMVFKELQAPAYCINIDRDAIVDTSPYVQNCSNINGPWMRNGVEWLPFQTEQPDLNGTFVAGPRPLKDDEIFPALVNQYGIDVRGSGGGMLIDGDRYSSESPIKSMVADAFTQVAQGSVGFHIANMGYMQLVSCFAVFCDKAFYTTNGGYLSISNSVCDFGNTGFTADGYYYEPYATGAVANDYYSTVASVTVTSEGAGYTSAPDVFIDPPSTPGGTTATAIATLDTFRGTISAITILDSGSGYTAIPNISIIGGGSPSVTAIGTANLATNIFIEVGEVGDKPQVASVMFLGDDPTGYYISSTRNSTQSFRYNEQKCKRDVGYIVDAVLSDAALNTNHQSVYAGVSYLRSYSSKVLSLQKAPTIDGVTEAKAQVLARVTDPIALARISDNFDIVLNILENGTGGIDAVTLPELVGRESGFDQAKNILLANKSFIKDEITAWIAENITGFEYDPVKCSRDVGLIVESVLADMILGTTYNSVYAGLSYLRSYSSTVISSQKKQTIAGINRAKEVVLNLITDYNTELIISNNFKIITDIIQRGAIAAPQITYTNPIGIDGGTANSIAQLRANKNFIAEEVIAYINAYLSPSTIPNYNENVCKRDVGYLVDALIFDLSYNGNSATVNAALSYYIGAASTVENEESAFVAAYTRLQDIIEFIILADNTGWTKTPGNPLTQNIANPAGNTVSSDTLVDLIQIVIDVVQLGTAQAPVIIQPTYSAGAYYNVKNADRLQVLVNLSTIQSDVIEFLDKTYAGNFTYNEAVCRRDIDYILDAIAYDLAYGGDSQTKNAALAYAEGSVLAGELEQTIAAYVHWKDILYDIVRNIQITPTVGNNSIQNTSLSVGTPVPDYRVAVVAQNLLQIVIDVLDNGTGYVPEPATLPQFNLAPAGLTQIRSDVLADIITIQDEVILYLNTTYGGSIEVKVFPGIISIPQGTEVRFHNVSTISTGGTALEYVGAGVTYNALPFFGGEPIPENERIEIDNGKCFTVTNDQVGNFRVGGIFNVNALTGGVTISAEDLDLRGLTQIGPLRRDGVPVGVVLKEISNNPLLVASTGSPDVNTVPTQIAVREYVEDNYLNKIQGTTPQIVESDVAFNKDLAVNGGDLTTTAATFNLINDSAETVNFAGAATSIEIGAAIGNTSINHNLLVDGTVTISGGEIAATTTSFNLIESVVENLLFANNASSITIGDIVGETVIRHNLEVGIDLHVVGGNLTTDSTAFNLIDTTAETVNFAGGATTLNIASNSGNTNVLNSFNVDINSRLGIDTNSINSINGSLTIDMKDNTADIFNLKEGINSYIKINTDNSLEIISFGSTPKYEFLNTTEASSTTVASTTFAGGVGIAKKLFVGGDLDADGSTVLGTTRATDTHTVTGSVNVNLPDAAAAAFELKENTQSYFKLDTTNGLELITLGQITKVLIENTTDSTDKDTGALVVEGGVGIEKKLYVGTDLAVGGSTTVTGDIAVNGGDLTTTATTFNLLDATATTVNAFGAATVIDIGAATGTLTINNQQIIFNSTDSVQLPVGTTAERDQTPTAGQVRYNSQLSTFEGYGPGGSWGSLGGVKDVDGNTYIIPETAPGANENTLYFYNNGTLTLTLTETAFNLKSGVDAIISSTTASTTKTTGALVVVGGVGISGTVNADELTLTTELEVQYGGTGVGTFTTNGILFGNSADPVLVTAASTPGSNAVTSYGILSTDINNVPVWTDVIDGGSY